MNHLIVRSAVVGLSCMACTCTTAQGGSSLQSVSPLPHTHSHSQLPSLNGRVLGGAWARSVCCMHYPRWLARSRNNSARAGTDSSDSGTLSRKHKRPHTSQLSMLTAKRRAHTQCAWATRSGNKQQGAADTCSSSH